MRGWVPLQRDRLEGLAWTEVMDSQAEAGSAWTEANRPLFGDLKASSRSPCKSKTNDMNKDQAQRVLDSAHEAANAIVAARGPHLLPEDADALYDRIFFGLLVDLFGDMSLDEITRLIDGPDL
jgi:hypothetical protein